MPVHTGHPLASLAYKNWYWAFDQLFRDEQVDRIHRICMAKEEQEALTGNKKEAASADHNMRKNKVTWNDDAELYGMLWPHLNFVNAAAGWRFAITACEPLQYTIYYNSKNHYDWHIDSMPGDEGTDTIRKISAVVQLSDPAEYEGGDFNIATVEKDATDWSAWPVDIPQLKQRGAAIFFPSTLFHRVQPITNGTRRTLVAWFRGPAWR